MNHLEQQKKHQSAITKLLLQLKLANFVNKWKKQTKKSKHRYLILEEWVKTELAYINDLKIIQELIQAPLKKLELISEEEERIIFPSLDAMIKLSEKLYEVITLMLKQFHPIQTLIGEKIIYFHKFFMIYREYCNNFMKGQTIIKALKKRPEAIKLQDNLTMDFQSYIIKPVQRPPKYQLLLRQYQKDLYPTHKDYAIMSEAIEKYHEVNEMNNQSMDRQYRDQKMIHLEQLYSGIISSKSGRIYLKEFEGKCMDFYCKMYIFNDMILIMKVIDESRQTIHKRIMLDGYSYVHLIPDGKYFSNRVFVCGNSINAHLLFISHADAKYFYRQIVQVVKVLGEKQEHRRSIYHEMETKRKNLAKVRVTKWIDESAFRIFAKPHLQVTVVNIFIYGNEFFYVIKFKIIHPHHINQKIFIRSEDLLEMQAYLQKKYDKISIPFIQEDNSKTVSFEKNSMQIAQFLNFIFRNEQFYQDWPIIYKQFRILESLWQIATTNDSFACYCNKCIELDENISNVQFYIDAFQELFDIKQKFKEKNNKSRIGVSTVQSTQSNCRKNQKEPKSSVTHESALHYMQKYKKQYCAFYILQLNSLICSKLAQQQLNTLESRFLRLSCALGWLHHNIQQEHSHVTFQQNVTIECNLTSIEDPISQLMANSNSSINGSNGSINGSINGNSSINGSNGNIAVHTVLRVYFASLSEDYIDIKLHKDTRVRSILEDIEYRYNLCADDFALFLYNPKNIHPQSEYLHIDNDQPIYAFLQRHHIELEDITSTVRLSTQEEQSFFTKKIGEIKKWGQEFIGTKRCRIYFQKYLHLQPALEIDCCINHPERYGLIVNQFFKRIKLSQIPLTLQQQIHISGLYYSIKQYQKLKYLTIDNFQVEKLKILLPSSRWQDLLDTQFQKEVYKMSKQCWDEILSLKKVRNALDFIYSKCLLFAVNIKQWFISQFHINNYDSFSFASNESKQLILGVSLNGITIRSQEESNSSRSYLLELPLDELKYKCTMKSIFFELATQVLRFDSLHIYEIQQILEIYMKYHEIFYKKKA